MPSHLVLNLSALLALLPACFAVQRAPARDGLFWSTLALAAVAPALTVLGLMEGAWRTGIGAALWLTVAACLALFAALAIASRTAARLAPLLLPYLAGLGGLATAFGQPAEPSFALVIALLIAHQRFGLRGRRAARLVLVAYILLSLAYLGVKFVTDVLIA